MSFQDNYKAFLDRLPAVSRPIQKTSFNNKIMWTGLIIIVYFILLQITAWGVDEGQIQGLGIFELLLGSRIGSIMTLGIGPIVTSSIILQLLVGSKIIPWNLQEESGKILFQGTQKMMGIIFSFLEAFIFVAFGAVPAASPGLLWMIILQLAIGGILVIFMDEVISKWGIGSGISLFIVAGVSLQILSSAVNPFATNCPGGAKLCPPTPNNPPVGRIPQALFLLGFGQPLQAFISMLPVIATVLVFFLVVYANQIKVEIPLAFGSIRGFGRRWPLKFFYTSNIPVILIAALLANLQLIGRLLQQRGITFLGTFDSSGFATSGLFYYLTPPNLGTGSGIGMSIFFIILGIFTFFGALSAYLAKKRPVRVIPVFIALGIALWFALVFTNPGLSGITLITGEEILRVITYSLVLMGGAVLFSVFWVSTAGMDARTVAGQIESVGMQIPGYRRDPRIIEQVLNRYIPALTVLGAMGVGALAAYADFTGALGSGTGILLSTMIIYQLYEELSTRHIDDMPPSIRRFFE